MESRKELKNKGLKVLKNHYIIFILLCLIAAFLGSEFSNSISITKIEKELVPKEQQVVNKVKNEVNDKVVDTVDKNTNIDAGKKINKINKEKEKITNKILDNKRGVFAAVANTIDSGSLYLTLVFAFKSMVGSSQMSVIISIIISLLIFGFYWFFFVNIYKVLLRRMFLEGRVYEKISIKDLLFLVRVKKWFKATRSMARVVLYEFLWGFTIIGGIIKRYSYFLVPYIISENPDINGKDAIKLSRDMMYGHKMECFIIELSFIGWNILGFLTLGISNLVFADAYKIAVFSEYYVNLRSVSKDKNIKNIELLSDKYLYEKADNKLLNDTYYKSLNNINYTKYKPRNMKERVEDIFGINLSSKEKEEEYEKNRINELLIKNIESEAKGKSYPTKLYIIKEKEKRPRFEVVNYLRHYSIPTLILIFFTFSFVGWIWEVFLHLINDGEFVNRGILHGPWLPIYGTGGVLVLVLLNKLRDKPALEFISIIIVCGIVEYFTSYYLEIAHNGEKWWDYSGYFLNLNGRICAEGLLVFGLGGMAAVYAIAPLLDNLIKKINLRLVIIISILLLTVFTVDNIYSSKYPNKGDGITRYHSYYNYDIDNYVI